MKKQTFLPIFLLAGSAAAFVLRLLQNLYGFEPDTGLPVSGSPFGILLPILLAALAAVWFYLTRKLPAEHEPGPAFPEAFRTSRTGLLVPIAGIFLIAASGILDALFSLMGNLNGQMVMTGDGMVSMTGIAVMGGSLTGLSPRMLTILGVLTAVMALSLFPAATACFRSGSRESLSDGEVREAKPFPGNLLLAAPVCLVIRLVIVYRANSIDPSLSVYYIELLALVFLTLAFYRLSSFAFFSGSTRRFSLYAGAAVVLCLTTLADGHGLTASLFYLGEAVTLLGFLVPRFSAVQRGNE